VEASASSPTKASTATSVFAGDIAYLYDIRCENGKLRIIAYTATERDDVWTVEKFFEGSIAQLKRRKP
jgi:hypothetical protein